MPPTTGLQTERGIDPDSAPPGSMTLAAAVAIFLADLRLAPRSRKTYAQGLRKFVDHLERHEGIDPTDFPVAELTIEHVTTFAATIVPEDIHSPEEVSRMRTAQNYLAAVRKFCSWLSAYDYHPNLSTDRIKVRIGAMMPRFSAPPPDVRLPDLERIVEFVSSRPKEEKPHLDLRRLKVQAMILFMFRSGVRVSELCALRRRDIDLEHGTAGIYRAKGGKSRTVHFDAGTARALAAYWQARGDELRGSGAFPAFSGRDKIGQPGSAISPRTVEHIVAELCTAIGIESDVTPHSFRHGLATELVRRRVRETTVQTILGHASPQTTRIYVHQSGAEVAEEYQDAFGAYSKPGTRVE
ncbi:MAG TPA: tyrosine-type recombinase/integrase [Thermomicrobiales bacterium]|nr:tyrosine-type recombinase/integrase [Thermomicrobiales bacterium]